MCADRRDDDRAGAAVPEEITVTRRFECPWRNSHTDPPQVGEEVYYFGPNIGIGIGRYKYKEQVIKGIKGGKDIQLCPHIFTNNVFGVVDACDAPRWRSYDPEHAKGYVPMPPYEYIKEIAQELGLI